MGKCLFHINIIMRDINRHLKPKNAHAQRCHANRHHLVLKTVEYCVEVLEISARNRALTPSDV